MPVSNNIHINTIGHRLRTYAQITGITLICLMIAACSSNNPTGPRQKTVAPGYSKDTQRSVEAAFCEGRANDVVTQLTSEPLASPTDRFYLALALEESGHPTRAQALYAHLMQNGVDGYVRIRCGRNILADGSLAEQSAQRLASIARNLAILDVNLRPAPRLHKGLPADTKSTGNKRSSNSYSGPAIAVETPASQSPFGQWFSHLTSYRTFDNAVKNKRVLEKKFPALKGIIDQWEVTSSGRQAIRLGIRMENKADAQTLCNSVKSQGEYCAVMDTSK